MKILLIQPNYPFYKLKFPPLGIGYIAGYIRNAHDVKIIDLNVETYDKFRRVLNNVDVVGINCLTRTFYYVKKLANSIKNISKDIIVIVGGPHVTFTPIETLKKNSNIDIVVRGEGEKTMEELLDRLERGISLNKVKGIAYRENGKIKLNKKRNLIEDINAIPFPAYDLMNMDEYKKNKMYGEPVTHIITSRGCPYRCIFCICALLYDRKVRYRNPQNICAEIELLKNKYGFRSFCFEGDTFGTNKKLAKMICLEIIKRNLDIKWWCETRLDIIDDNLLKLMRKAGCMGIAFGLESGNQKILKVIKKGINLKLAKRGIYLAKKYGFNIQISLILGLPGETNETILDTISFANDLDIDAYSVNILTPYPGTEVYIKRKEYGIEIVANKWNGYIKVDTPVIRTKNFSAKKLKEMRIYVAETLNKTQVSKNKIFNSYLETFVHRE